MSSLAGRIFAGTARLVPQAAVLPFARPAAVFFHGVERQIDDDVLQNNHHEREAFAAMMGELRARFDVLPLAAPGILTGTIIGLAHALGETAPLLLIGMVAFVADVPSTPMDPATALPVQIYMWANEAERAFVERTSGAIIVLLLFLAVMNIAAIILRRRFERRW